MKKLIMATDNEKTSHDGGIVASHQKSLFLTFLKNN
jgi:hypothetical protein